MKTTTQMKEAMDLLQETKILLFNVGEVFRADKRKASSDVCLDKFRKIHAFQRRWSKSRKQPQ